MISSFPPYHINSKGLLVKKAKMQIATKSEHGGGPPSYVTDFSDSQLMLSAKFTGHSRPFRPQSTALAILITHYSENSI